MHSVYVYRNNSPQAPTTGKTVMETATLTLLPLPKGGTPDRPQRTSPRTALTVAVAASRQHTVIFFCKTNACACARTRDVRMRAAEGMGWCSQQHAETITINKSTQPSATATKATNATITNTTRILRRRKRVLQNALCKRVRWSRRRGRSVGASTVKAPTGNVASFGATVAIASAIRPSWLLQLRFDRIQSFGYDVLVRSLASSERMRRVDDEYVRAHRRGEYGGMLWWVFGVIFMHALLAARKSELQCLPLFLLLLLLHKRASVCVCVCMYVYSCVCVYVFFFLLLSGAVVSYSTTKFLPHEVQI